MPADTAKKASSAAKDRPKKASSAGSTSATAPPPRLGSGDSRQSRKRQSPDNDGEDGLTVTQERAEAASREARLAATQLKQLTRRLDGAVVELRQERWEVGEAVLPTLQTWVARLAAIVEAREKGEAQAQQQEQLAQNLHAVFDAQVEAERWREQLRSEQEAEREAESRRLRAASEAAAAESAASEAREALRRALAARARA